MNLLEKYCTDKENYWFDIEHIFASDTTSPHISIYMSGEYIYVFVVRL